MFRVGIATLVFVALLYSGLRIYSVYCTHRVVSLMEKAARIQIGAGEESIRPLLERFNGVKLQPEPRLSVDDCPDKAECAYQNAQIPDYTYEFDLSPFQVFPRHELKMVTSRRGWAI